MANYSSTEELQAQGLQVITRPLAHFKPKNPRGVASKQLASKKKESKTIELVYQWLARLASISPQYPADRAERRVRALIKEFFS
jgi:hypothetical protein